MADERTGEAVTANYGWVKPNPGASDDVWGGQINIDLDGIDSTVHGIQTSIPVASVTPPVMNGTAAAGSATTWSRSDHVHPNDTTKYDTTNPAGYQTAAQVTASLAPYALVSSVPVASAAAPVMDSVANAGSSAAFSRGDHVHPTDTSRYAASNPSGYQTAAQVTTSLAPYALTSAVPVASSTTPVMDGAAAVGAGTTWARADHVHPTDTSRAAASALAGYLPLAGGTLTGPLGGTTATFSGDIVGNLRIVNDLPATSAKQVIGRSAGSNRWVMNLGAGGTESGGNVANDFVLASYADNGSFLAQPLSIERKTGIVTIPNLNAPQAIGDNRIINGDFRLDQRNNGSAGTAIAVYTADRWLYASNIAAKFTWQRQGPAGQAAAISQAGFPYYFQFISSSTYVSAAGDNFNLHQRIEADMLNDFAWGTASAQPVTLSFWVYSTLTGTFGGAIQNAPSPGTRSYPFTYSIPVASTWTRIVITIPGDTGGTWVSSGNAEGARVNFDLGTGSTFLGAANVWQAGNIVGAIGDVKVVGTNAAQFNITGVKLEVGPVATPYNRQTMAKSMADCQRYYQTSGNVCLEGYSGAASSTVGSTIWFQAQMRAFPTLVTSGATYSNSSALAFDQITQNVCRALWTGSSIGRSAISGISISLSAEL
jgi:hypothetical protein